ncbi:hypothetical protein BHE74_00037607 [Ensete ventricosum]|nr:hypothetical protein GW17_00036674 [Ensete ventricosum]RWW55728.1 hypothetical protein BHE74_00037607 [Ensete ventricosum]
MSSPGICIFLLLATTVFSQCSPKSSSSMDESSSKAFEAIIREHDEDSTIIESSLPKIRATHRIPGDIDLTHLRLAPRPAIETTTKKPTIVEVEAPLKKASDSTGMAKDASPTPTSRSRPIPGVPRREGSSHKKEKGVNRPWSMRELCRVKAYAPDEPYMAREMVDLPELVWDSPLKASSSLSMILIDRVCDSGRVIDNLSRLNEKLHADVQKLKDECRPIVVAKIEAWTSEVTMKLDEAQCREPEALKTVKALEKELQVLKGDLEVAQAKTREMEELLLMARMARKKAKSYLTAKLNATTEKAQVAIAQYKESVDFTSGLEKIG